MNVRINHLKKKYGAQAVLNDITLDIKSESFTCFFGPPGAGKSTLLRILAGIEPPDEGRIYFDGQDVTDLSPKERDIAMVFQNFALYPHFKVYDNIASPLKVAKRPKDEIDEKVREVARFLKIDHLLDRYPVYLSGGEKQRVAIARALAKSPKIYLFDEPLTNVDAKIRLTMRTELKMMQKKLKQTIIYATPDPVEVLTMGDKVAVMDLGVIHHYSSVEEAYERPTDLITGSYLGYPSMNIIDCSLLEKDGNLILDAGAFTVDATPIKDEIKQLTHKELKIGLRPEHIELSLHPLKKESATTRMLKMKVFGAEVVGSDTIVYTKIDDLLLKAFVPSVYMVKKDSDIWLSFNLNKLYLFDKKTGKKI